MSDKIEKEAKSLEGLPKEILVEIMKSLEIKDLARLERTSKDISVWAKEQKKNKLAQKFNEAVNNFIEKARKLEEERKEVENEEDELWGS